MPELIKTIIDFCQQNRTMLLMGSSVFSFIFLIYFLTRNWRHDFKTRLLGLIAFLVGIAVFIGFFTGGVYLGKRFGWGDYGGLIGIAAFWLLVALIGYLRTPKHLRRRSKF